jgi:hypothetical protein
VTAREVLGLMPHGWTAADPLVFEGLRKGQFIARVCGSDDGGHPAARRLGGSSRGRGHWELEGYGSSHAAALDDLLTKLQSAS